MGVQGSITPLHKDCPSYSMSLEINPGLTDDSNYTLGKFTLYGGNDLRLKPVPSIKLCNTASDASSKTLTEWIANCSNNHTSCKQLGQRLENEKSWRPTRLLQIESAGKDSSCKIRVVEEQQDEGTTEFRYATLSYCWGTAPFIKLLGDNLVDFRSGIEASVLPKTFQDAIAAAERLGIRYLWIDALCIIQDSPEDWARESILMAKVYSYSTVTLAAAASKDSNGGLFRDRDPQLLNGVKIPISWGKFCQGEHYCIRQDPWVDFVCDSPLLKRAWVFQERLLSPRTIYFASDQLYWECGELYASEIYPAGGPWDLAFRQRRLDTATRLPDGLEPSHDGRLKHNYSAMVLHGSQRLNMSTAEILPYLWANIVSEYSNGSLTFEKDKLIAISGVATSIARLIGDHTYVAGMWQSHLPLGLLWHSTWSNDRNDGGNARPSRMQQYQAPSWSWASMASRVNMEILFRALEPPNITIQTISVDIPLVTGGARTTGQVGEGCTIRIKGYLSRARYASTLNSKLLNPLSELLSKSSRGLNIADRIRHVYASYEFQECFIFTRKGVASHHPSVFVFDENQEDRNFIPGTEVFCLEIATGRSSLFSGTEFIAGLLLRPTEVKGQFSRVGYFELYPLWMRRSWRAGGHKGPLKRRDVDELGNAIFRGQDIEAMYYEEVDGDLYTISII